MKFESQRQLIDMIVGAIRGLELTTEDYEFTKKSSETLDRMPKGSEIDLEKYEEYLEQYVEDYRKYICSRYVNIMPRHVGVTSQPLADAIFYFRIGDTPGLEDLFAARTAGLNYWDYGLVLLNDFLPNNCPEFNFIPR